MTHFSGPKMYYKRNSEKTSNVRYDFVESKTKTSLFRIFPGH